jgi:hypothetical protein
LDFEESFHQLGEVSHDFLQGWFTETIGDCRGEKLFNCDQFQGGRFPRLVPEKTIASRQPKAMLTKQ